MLITSNVIRLLRKCPPLITIFKNIKKKQKDKSKKLI